MKRRRPSPVVCARGAGGLASSELEALTRSVEAYMDTRCQAPSGVHLPDLGSGPQERTYHCGLPADHDADDGHLWPPEGRLIVAWCDWPRRG